MNVENFPVNNEWGFNDAVLGAAVMAKHANEPFFVVKDGKFFAAIDSEELKAEQCHADVILVVSPLSKMVPA